MQMIICMNLCSPAWRELCPSMFLHGMAVGDKQHVPRGNQAGINNDRQDID